MVQNYFYIILECEREIFYKICDFQERFGQCFDILPYW